MKLFYRIAAPTMPTYSPPACHVVAMRNRLKKCLGISKDLHAQDRCAEIVGVVRRVWQSWELGEEPMLEEHWEKFVAFVQQAEALEAARGVWGISVSAAINKQKGAQE